MPGVAPGIPTLSLSFVESSAPQVHDRVVNGIAIHWPIAGIVSALRQAFRERSIDGWVNLDTAARWVSEHHPEQTPKKYGCARWRHVIHESGQFELRRFTHTDSLGCGSANGSVQRVEEVLLPATAMAAARRQRLLDVAFAAPCIFD